MVDTQTLSIRDADSARQRRLRSTIDQTGLLSGDKLLGVIELLMRSDAPLSARAIADIVGINRSTTHRAINTLMHRGWVERVPNASAYRLSIKFLALAHVVTQDRSFLKEVRPALEALSTLCRETVHVGVLDGLEILHVDKIDSLERVGVASKIGSRGPAHTASLGKALLAASSDQVVEEYIARATAGRGPVRLADPEAFREEIALTRRRGYAIDDEEDAPGVRCLGVAIRGAGGAPLFAISVTGPSARFTLERVTAAAPRVVEIARQLSLRLGWEPEPEGILH
jgi:IclR family transcriptional regulator, KDG regulon repressor